MRILGLDLGSRSVKAVEVDSAFGRFEVHECHEAPVAPGQDPAVVAGELLRGLSKTPDRISVLLKASQVTFRNLDLPTRDRKAIQAGVAFELDDDLPFPLEESLFDYSVVQQVGQLTRLHAVAAMEAPLQEFLNRLLAAGVDPDVLTPEPWAFRTLLGKLNPGENQPPVLVMNFGQERTSLQIHWKGRPVLARDFPVGGRDLTHAIAERYHLSEEQAENAKLENGFVLAPSQRSQVTAEQVDFSNCLQPVLSELLREIRHSIFVCKNLIHESVGSIQITGGSSLLPGLVLTLEEELRIPVQPLHSLAGLTQDSVRYTEKSEATFGLAAGAALCLTGTERSLVINLRKGPLMKRSRTTQVDLTRLRRPLIGAGIVAASFLISLLVQSQVYSSRIRQTDEQLQKAVKGFFTGASPSAMRTYLANPSTLRKQLKGEVEKARQSERLAGPNPKSPLSLLKEVSLALPKDLVLDLIRYQAGASPTQPYLAGTDEPASLTFLVQNQASAERLASLLEKKLPGLSRTSLEQTKVPDGSMRFKITLTGKPAEDAYGK